MRKAFLMLCASTCAFAQFDGLAGSASRTVTFNADEVTFGISLTLSSGVTLDQAVGRLKDVGVTANDLTGISSYPYYSAESEGPGPTRLTYEFNVVKPFSEMTSLIGRLETARKAMAADEGELQFALSVGVSEAAVEQTRQKIFPELLAEARKNAEFLARTSQMTLGAIQTVSDNNTNGALGMGYYGGYPIPSASRAYLVRVTFSAYARWAAKAQ